MEACIKLAIEFTATGKRQQQVMGHTEAMKMVHKGARDQFRGTKEMKEAQTPGKPLLSKKAQAATAPAKAKAKAPVKKGKVHNITVEEEPKKTPKPVAASTPAKTDLSKMTCNKCGTKGHLAKTCKVKTAEKQPPKTVNQVEMEAYSGDEEDWADCFAIEDEEDFQ